ncbi:MAG: urease accessory protein UreE [Pseudomonadota bacterium]
MLLIEHIGHGTKPAQFDAQLTLPFDARCRSRLRTQLDSGEDVGLFLPRGTVLRGGDWLVGNDGRSVRVNAAAEPLYRVDPASATLLARAAYHLGNRHVALEVRADALLLLADPVLRVLLEKLGLAVTELDAPFEPEAGAYGGGHHHGEEPGHGGVIHGFNPAP